MQHTYCGVHVGVEMNQGEEWEFFGCLEAGKNLCKAEGVERCMHLQSPVLM